MEKIYLEVGTELIELSSTSQMQDSNNTFYRCDAEEQEDFYNSYMEGYYYEPDNTEALKNSKDLIEAAVPQVEHLVYSHSEWTVIHRPYT